MTYDTTVPDSLKEVQQWFGSIIGRPIDVNSQMNPISPSGVPMEEESWRYIAPSPSLQPAQRIQIYNQQYWWRLLSTLQEIFPTVTRLFGYHDFNQAIAIPFLTKYPPNHWSLHFVGSRLLQWVEEDYHENDKELVWNAVKMDWAFTDGFIAPSYPPIDLSKLPTPGDLSSILEETLYLQPHVQFFEMPYDMFLFRIDFLQQDADYWIDNDFPPLPLLPEGEKAFFIVYRLRNNDVTVEKVSKTEYLLLQNFREGSSVDAICQWLETQDEVVSQEAGENLHNWFQNWTLNQLLTLSKA